MLMRTLAGLCMAPLLYIIHIGNMPMYLMGLLLTIGGIYEFCKALNYDFKPATYTGYLISVLIFLIHVFNVRTYSIFWSCGLIMISLLFFYCLSFNKDIEDEHKEAILQGTGIFYIILGFEAMILVRDNLVNGEFLAYLIFVITIVSDSMAYFVGKTFGKMKIVPTISPNKTLEGSLGAILFTMIACMVYGRISTIKIGYLIIIGICGSVAAQMGDLLASKVKRILGIKDFSNLIPGHGGILDRLDSALLVAQIVFILMALSQISFV